MSEWPVAAVVPFHLVPSVQDWWAHVVLLDSALSDHCLSLCHLVLSLCVVHVDVEIWGVVDVSSDSSSVCSGGASFPMRASLSVASVSGMSAWPGINVRFGAGVMAS